MTGPRSLENHLLQLLAAAWDPHSVNLPGRIPWPEIAQLASAEGVASLVRAAVQEARLPLPVETAAALAHDYYLSATASILAAEALAPILAAFARAGVLPLLVKGLALAEGLYGNVALRSTTDIDLVVRPEEVPACRRILLDLGYTPVEVELTPGASLAYRSEQLFADPEQRRMPVELHWHLLDLPYYQRKVPMAWFWGHARPTQIAGHPVQVLDPEANLIYLSAHLALHHRFQGLRWFVDLAALVHRYQEVLDWQQVIATAQEFELLLAVREVLDRLAAYWPSLPLVDPRQQLHALEPTPFERRLFRLLTAEPRTPLLDFYSDLASLPGLPARLRFLLLNTFPQRAYMAHRYGVRHTWQLPYWYLYRLGDGAVKLSRTVRQLLRLRSA